jgi:hypothetical protein
MTNGSRGPPFGRFFYFKPEPCPVQDFKKNEENVMSDSLLSPATPKHIDEMPADCEKS